MKKFLVVALVMLLCVATLIGCASQTQEQATQSASAEQSQEEADEAASAGASKSGEQLKITFVAPKVNDPFWLIVKQGYEDAAEEFGFAAEWTGADDHSVDKTVEALENTIVQKPDGIVTCPFTPSAFTNALQKANDAGITVGLVTVDAESEDLRIAYAGTDSVEAGQLGAQKIAEALGEGTEVKLGVLMSNIDSENQVIQVQAAEDWFKDNNISYEIVDKQADDADSAKALEVTTSMLQAHPEINAILSVEAGGTPGVGKAIDELGLSGKIVAICSDATDVNMETIEAGRITGVIAQSPYKMGYYAAKYVFDSLNGEEVPSTTNTGSSFVGIDEIATYDPYIK